MKLADLRLDTVYADHDGRPLMVLSLEKYAKPKAGYGSRRIRLVNDFDKSFGVVILRQSYSSRAVDLDDLAAAAGPLRDALPEGETRVGEYVVEVAVLRNIVETWEEHLERSRAEGEARHRANLARGQARKARAGHISTIKKLLPEGIRVAGLSEHSDYAQIRLEDLIEVLTAGGAPAPTGSPRDMSLLAAGFDAAIASLRHEDGTPVDVVHVKNPYRS